jgi:D-3-phosphoglycerate dehydrogenase
VPQYDANFGTGALVGASLRLGAANEITERRKGAERLLHAAGDCRPRSQRAVSVARRHLHIPSLKGGDLTDKQGNKKRVLVPHVLAPAALELLRARDDVETEIFPNGISSDDFRELLRSREGVDGIVIGLTRFGETECQVTSSLRVVARIGVGYDTVDIPALSKRGIPLMVVGTANSPSVAEQALYFMFALAKRGPELHAMVRDGRWHGRTGALPVDLMDKTLLIVGFGRIGTRTAKRCLALEMKVQVYDPYVPASTVTAAGCEPVADLDAALPQADFVSIHCPKTPETIGMFGSARLARMKPSAYLINTARGGIIDEAALHAALTERRLAGAGLDVFDAEPTPADNPLLKLTNVIAAPHMAGVTRESVDRMGAQAVRNVLSVLDGHPIRENVINQDVLG